MADPWNKGRYRSRNHTTIMLIANFMACFIHMNNLNVLLHKNLIFIVYTLVIGALFCCTQWFFIRQDDYQFIVSEFIVQTIIFLGGTTIHLINFAQIKLDGYI